MKKDIKKWKKCQNFQSHNFLVQKLGRGCLGRENYQDRVSRLSTYLRSGRIIFKKKIDFQKTTKISTILFFITFHLKNQA